jgi:hypothetical protein
MAYEFSFDIQSDAYDVCDSYYATAENTVNYVPEERCQPYILDACKNPINMLV